MERNPILSLRTADPLSRVRKRAVAEENIKQYFLLLEKTLRDETGMPLDTKPLKIVALRGARNVQGPSTGDKSQITIVACANAAGCVLPPMVIFKGEHFNHEWSVGEVPDTLYRMDRPGTLFLLA